MNTQPQLIKHHIQVDGLVAMNRELQAQIQQLKDEFLNQKNSHLENDLDLFIQQTQKKIKQLEAEAAQLNAQNRDLDQQLRNQSKELESCYQEVQHTSQELCQALNSNQVSYRQAIASAKRILCDDQPSSEAVARLLQVIYGQDVSAISLERLRRYLSPQPRFFCTDSTYLLSKEAIAYNHRHDQLKAQSMALKAQSMALKAQSMALKAQSIRLKVRSQGLKAQFQALAAQFQSSKTQYLELNR